MAKTYLNIFIEGNKVGQFKKRILDASEKEIKKIFEDYQIHFNSELGSSP